MSYPGFIIISNKDLVQSIQDTLKKQLFLNEIITSEEFNTRVSANSNYPTEIRINQIRIMVLKNLDDFSNTNLADIVIFIKAGLASVEYNKFGPPAKTYPVDKLTITQLIGLNYANITNSNSQNVQNNISAPLFAPKNEILLFPLGSDIKE